MKISDEILEVLSNRLNVDGNSVVISGQLDRKLYVKVNEVLEGVGGKWNRSAKAHVFPSDAAERIDEVVLTGEVETVKDFLKRTQLFETPRDLARQLVNQLDLKPKMSVLEPSAGKGALVNAVLDHISPKRCETFVIEKDETLVTHLMERFNAPILLGEVKLFQHDFLTWAGATAFDRIVMNPPFSKGQDAKHIFLAYKLLKPKGKLVAIASAGVKFRNGGDYPTLRQLIVERGMMTDNAPGAFKSSGTSINTITIVLNK